MAQDEWFIGFGIVHAVQTGMRNPILLALIPLACVSCQDAVTAPTPSPATSSFSVISTSQPSGGTLPLPATWPQNTRVLAPTVTVQFVYRESLPLALFVVDLMMGSNVCLEAEGLQMGPGYATIGPYAGGSITMTGNNFERNIGYPLCGATGFTTDHLRFRLISRSGPSSPGGSNTDTEVFTADVPLTWTFSK